MTRIDDGRIAQKGLKNQRSNMTFQIPTSLKLEHEELHTELIRATPKPAVRSTRQRRELQKFYTTIL